MSGFIKTIAEAFTQDVERAKRIARRDAILVALSGLFGLTAYAAGIVAATIYAAETYGPVASAMVLCLAAILAMLVVLVVLRVMQLRDRRETRRADSRTRLVATLGTALLPLVFKSRAAGTTALIGGIALVANELLKSSGRQPAHPAPSMAEQPRMQPTHTARVNGAINPHIHNRQQETYR